MAPLRRHMRASMVTPLPDTMKGERQEVVSMGAEVKREIGENAENDILEEAEYITAAPADTHGPREKRTPAIEVRYAAE